jgi:hypothetical protein
LSSSASSAGWKAEAGGGGRESREVMVNLR